MVTPAELYAALHKRVDVFSHKSKRLYEGDVEALHRTRVASRRLRELLPVLRLDARTTRKLSRRLRTVTKRLGAVRDVDVLICLIEELHRDRRYPRNALQTVRLAVEEERKTAREQLDARLPPEKMQKVTRRLKRLAKQLEADDTSSHQADGPRLRKTTLWALEARTTRRAARAAAAITAAGTVYAPAPLHQVRIALKKLRFAVELKAEASVQPATRDIAALKGAQDVLGRLHDRQVLIDRAREIQSSRLAPDPAAWRDLGSLVRLLERDCRKLHARYVRTASNLIAIAEHAGGLKAAARLGRSEGRRERRPA
jgi:CHAD domain-containing protein